MLTFGDARKIIAPWAARGGKCASSEEVRLFVMQTLQYLLFSGQYPTTRKFCFNAVKGCFTIPYELEVPLKIKIDGEVGTVWDKWYEFYNINEIEGCLPVSNALREDPNFYATVYDLPCSGSRVGCLATACEDADAHIIVQGVDPSGREVVTNHKGEQIVGEYLSIKKGSLQYTATDFGKITNITKTKTNGYVQLWWVNSTNMTKGFLADYSPLEEHPQYRRFRITSPHCGSCVKVSILGRIRLKENYADNDIIPFDNLNTLQSAAQAINAGYNNDLNTAQAHDVRMRDLIGREANYKKPNTGQPIEIEYLTSGGSIKNIV